MKGKRVLWKLAMPEADQRVISWSMGPPGPMVMLAPEMVKKVSRDALQLGAVRVEQELPSSYSHELSDEKYPGGPYGPVVGTGLSTPGELALVVEAERLGLVVLEVGHLVVRPPGKSMSERRGRLRDRLGLVVRVRGLEVRAMLRSRLPVQTH